MPSLFNTTEGICKKNRCPVVCLFVCGGAHVNACTCSFMNIVSGEVGLNESKMFFECV